MKISPFAPHLHSLSKVKKKVYPRANFNTQKNLGENKMAHTGCGMIFPFLIKINVPYCGGCIRPLLENNRVLFYDFLCYLCP